MARNTGSMVCLVNQCGRLARRKSYCDKHYQQIKKWGEIRDRQKFEKCTAYGCERGTRSKYSPYCEMHYYRFRRNGTLDTVAKRVPDTECIAPDCYELAFYTTGECRNHYLAKRANGDYEKRVGKERNYNWLKDGELNYSAIHLRLAKYRGSAKDYHCISCGSPALHWAYQHNCQNEQIDDTNGRKLPYSPNLEKYEPMCVPCHKKLDLTIRQGDSNV